MAYSQGIDFRATSGYVTDPDRHDCDLASGTYPRTTAQGNTVGWETSLPRGARDRLNSVDARLAGIHYVSAPTTLSYRFDLPRAGDYKVRLAAGDATTPNPVRIELFDDTTSKGVLANGAASGTNMRDATNTALSLAAWPGSNTAVTVAFASTVCRFKVGANSGTDNYIIAHLYVESAEEDVTALAGAARAVASSDGALSVNIPLVSAAVGVATASGALSTALKLSSGAVAVAQASGTLTVGIVHAVFSSRRGLAPAVRHFLDFLGETMPGKNSTEVGEAGLPAQPSQS